MKFVRALGGFLCFIGILVALVGIFATAVPMIDNEQVKRIVESFSLQSADQMLNTVNQVILYCLAHGSLLFGAGAVTLLVGGLMKSAAERTLYRNEPEKQPAQRMAENREVSRSTPATAVRETPAPAKRAPVATPGYSPPSLARTAAMATGASDLFSAPPSEEKYRPRSIIDLADGLEPNDSIEKDTDSAYRTKTPITDQKSSPERAENPVYVARYQVGPASTHCAECGAENLLEQPVCSRCGQALHVATNTQPQAAYPQEPLRRVTHAADMADSMENRPSAYRAPSTLGNAEMHDRQTQEFVKRIEEKPDKVVFHPPIPEKDPWKATSTDRGAQTGNELNSAMGLRAGGVKLSGSLMTQQNAQNPAGDGAGVDDPRHAQQQASMASGMSANAAEPSSPYGKAQAAGQTIPSTDGKEPFRPNEENPKAKSHIRIVSTMGKHNV